MGHPHLPQALLRKNPQATPAMMFHQTSMAVRNRRSGASAAKAGCRSQELICLMATVLTPVGAADIVR